MLARNSRSYMSPPHPTPSPNPPHTHTYAYTGIAMTTTAEREAAPIIFLVTVTKCLTETTHERESSFQLMVSGDFGQSWWHDSRRGSVQGGLSTRWLVHQRKKERKKMTQMEFPFNAHSSDQLLPARQQLPKVPQPPKQCHRLGTKCSNACMTL